MGRTNYPSKQARRRQRDVQFMPLETEYDVILSNGSELTTLRLTGTLSTCWAMAVKQAASGMSEHEVWVPQEIVPVGTAMFSTV